MCDLSVGLHPASAMVVAIRTANQAVKQRVSAHFLENICNLLIRLRSEEGALIPKWSRYEQKTSRPVGLPAHHH
jgi:hypothetical protein